MIKIVKAAMVALLLTASAGFGAEAKVGPVRDLVLPNLKGISTQHSLKALRLKKQDVDTVLALLKLDQANTGNLKSLVIFSSLSPDKASELFIVFAGPGDSRAALLGKPMTGRYLTI